MNKDTVVTTNEGKPFRTRQAAEAQKSRIVNQQNIDENILDVVDYCGGFAVRIAAQEENKEITVISADTPETVISADTPEIATKGPNRPKRKPIGTRNVLKYPDRPGFKRRVVNDTDDRIQVFLDAGYKIVEGNHSGGDMESSEGSKFGSAISKHVGHGTRGVLMEIPMEWYEEDQKAKQDRITMQESGMKKAIGNEANQAGQYGKVDIST